MMAINVSALSLGRALGAFVAPTLYAWGMGTSAGAAIVFNLLALIALRWVRYQDIHKVSALGIIFITLLVAEIPKTL